MIKINSKFGLLDIKEGRQRVIKLLKKGRVPVTVSGFITEEWNTDDVSTQFEMEIKSVTVNE